MPFALVARENGAALVVEGVQHDRHRVVAADVLVSEHRARTALLGAPLRVGRRVAFVRVLAHCAEEPEVEVFVVIDDSNDGLLGRGQALVGLLLVEVADGASAFPGGLVQPTVYLDRLPNPLGVDFPGSGLQRPDPFLAGHADEFGGARRSCGRIGQPQRGR